MTRTTLFATGAATIVTAGIALAALTLSAPEAQAFGGSWQCEDSMDMDRDEARAISGTNNALFNLLNEYRERWDAQYKLKQCKAFAEGRPYNISCLNNRRDWDAIKGMVPEELFGMSSREVTPYYQELQMADDGARDMAVYCRSVGAIE